MTGRLLAAPALGVVLILVPADCGQTVAEGVSGDQVEPVPVQGDGVIQDGEQCGGINQAAC